MIYVIKIPHDDRVSLFEFKDNDDFIKKAAKAGWFIKDFNPEEHELKPDEIFDYLTENVNGDYLPTGAHYLEGRKIYTVCLGEFNYPTAYPPTDLQHAEDWISEGLDSCLFIRCKAALERALKYDQHQKWDVQHTAKRIDPEDLRK